MLTAVLVIAMMGLLSGVAISATDFPQPTHTISSSQARTRSYQAQARFFQAAALDHQGRRHTPQVSNERLSARPTWLAHISHELPITTHPGKGRVVGTMPAESLYFGEPLTAWIQETTSNGRYGKVTVPFDKTSASGWIPTAGLELSHTPYSVRVDRSRHLLTVMRLGKVIMSFPAATGAPATPTPLGRYFVTDRVPIPSGGSFGDYAFGLPGYNRICRRGGREAISSRFMGRMTRVRSEPPPAPVVSEWTSML